MSVAIYTGADLRFDAEPHLYSLPDGRPVPNVTTILRAVGVSTDFEAIASLSARRAQRIDEKRAIGTAVHADCHAFDDDDLDVESVHPKVRPYFDCWPVFRQNTGATPLTRERRVLHPMYFFCGTLDGIFLVHGRRVLIDIKTGDPDSAAAHLQTAAYEAAYLIEHPGEAIDERWSVQLVPGKRVPYDIVNYSSRPEAWRDFQKFQACLTVYNEQPERRRLR